MVNRAFIFSTIYVLIALYLANGSYYTCMYTFFFNRQINHPKIENRFYSCTYIILTEHEIDFQNLNVVLKTVTIHVFSPQIKPTEHKKF